MNATACNEAALDGEITAAQTHRLCLNADAQAPERASEWLLNLCRQHGLSESQLFHLDLCACELVDNVLEHACIGQSNCEFELVLELKGRELALTVIDQGAAFDPLAHHVAPQPKNLQEAPIGGLGIHLVRQFANRVEYLRADGKNHITIHILENLPEPHAR